MIDINALSKECKERKDFSLVKKIGEKGEKIQKAMEEHEALISNSGIQTNIKDKGRKIVNLIRDNIHIDLKIGKIEVE